MLMILARLVRSESFWAVAKVRSPHTGPGIRYIIYPSPPREGRTEAPVGTPQFPSPLGGGRTEAYPVGPALSLA